MFPHASRRQFLGGVAAFTAWASIPKLAIAAGGRDPRLLTIILRGGMDGLGAVAPVGDPDYERVRDEFEMPLEGPNAAIPLNDFFALNRRMQTIGDLYGKGEALFVHACHTPYRSRSHFEAQDVLENGTISEGYSRDGWLGRAISRLPADTGIARSRAFAAASETPLVLRGASEVVTWLPPGFSEVSNDTRQRLLSLYEHTDPVLAAALESGFDLETVTGSEAELAQQIKSGMDSMEVRGRDRQVVAAATAAGRALAADDGPRVGFLDLSGFDTHRRQLVVDGALGQTLETLDAAVAALRRALGPVWEDTVVILVTEFGRTVRMNSSNGTDHGTATVATLLGGAVQGGRVIADWPGLSDKALYEGRDLAPTTDVRSIFKGVLRDHLGLEQQELAGVVFPETTDLAPMNNLVRSSGG